MCFHFADAKTEGQKAGAICLRSHTHSQGTERVEHRPPTCTLAGRGTLQRAHLPLPLRLRHHASPSSLPKPNPPQDFPRALSTRCPC